MYDLARFGLSEMTRMGSDIRRLAHGASSMEEVSGRLCRLLYDHLRDGPDARACALVRTFVTAPYARLDDEQRGFARGLLGEDPAPAMKCLTLLATAGEESAWNERRRSAGHLALPLPSPESVSRSPMIAQLIRQLGVEIDPLLAADPTLLMDAEQHSFNVFHVSEARGSEYIPAQQQFVIPYGVRSVVGFGGVLPPGELFATIVFTRVAVSRETADLFRTLALNVKVAMLPFAGARVFT